MCGGKISTNVLSLKILSFLGGGEIIITSLFDISLGSTSI
jgi:hypothetical protein